MALTEKFEEALLFATRLHARQARKGTAIPYVSHLLIVAGYVLDDGGTEEEAIAALLHDAVEDQGGRDTADQIRSRFGSRVAMIVEACSDTDVEPKPPWKERKEAYIAHIGQSAPEVRRVSAADKLHNARAILRDLRAQGESLWTRFNGGRDGTLWYYRALAEAFSEVGQTSLTQELMRVVVEMERVAAEAAVSKSGADAEVA